MSVLTLAHGIRRARKAYLCQLCSASIKPGDHYSFSNNVYDDRAYTWRECLACGRDLIAAYVYDFWGQPDEGIDIDSARDWAEEAMSWPLVGFWRTQRRMKAGEHQAARNWLARASVRTAS